MADNQVYECERCHEYYTDMDIKKVDRKEIPYIVKSEVGLCGLCPNCRKALTQFMEKGNDEKEEISVDGDAIQRMVIEAFVNRAWADLKKGD